MVASLEILEQWQGRETVRLSEVARAVDMPRSTRDFAVRTGAIKPSTRKGRGSAVLLEWEEVVLIVAAAALAAAAGVAVTVIIRALRESGVQVSPAGVTIPLGSAA